MSENAVGRRQALRGAGIAAGGVAIAGLATATPAAAGNDNGLLGSWMCVRQAGPPFTGTWSSKGKSFRATFWTGFPGEQGPDSVGPTVRVQLRGALSHGMISATYRVTVFAPGSATEVVETVTGTLTGRRINA